MKLSKKLLTILSLTVLTSAAQADTFTVDATKSLVGWKGTKITGSSHDGTLSLKTGVVEIADGKIASGTFTVDMNTLKNTDLASDPTTQTKLINHLKSADFFNVEQFPEAKFEVTSVETKSATDVILKGNLTLLGKTNPIEVTAKVNIAADKVTGEANLTLDRTLWGLKYASGKFFQSLGDKIIKDEFNLTLKLEAVKK